MSDESNRRFRPYPRSVEKAIGRSVLCLGPLVFVPIFLCQLNRIGGKHWDFAAFSALIESLGIMLTYSIGMSVAMRFKWSRKKIVKLIDKWQ